MCNIKRQHASFKRYCNAIDSNHNKDYPVAFIDDFLHTAHLDFIEMNYAGNNFKNYKIGFEVTQQRVDMLNHLLITQRQIKPIDQNKEFGFYVYEFNLGSETLPYFHLIRSNVFIKSCNKYLNVEIVRHNDLNSLLKDNYRKPNYIWNRILGTVKSATTALSKHSLYIYSDVEIDSLDIVYLKVPKKPFFGGYDTLEYSNNADGYSKTDDPVDMEVSNDHYCDVVADMAAQIALGIVGNYQTYKEQRILNRT